MKKLKKEMEDSRMKKEKKEREYSRMKKGKRQFLDFLSLCKENSRMLTANI